MGLNHNDHDHAADRIAEGMSVTTADGAYVGVVAQVSDDFFIISNDAFHRDYRVPFDAVSAIAEERISLDLSEQDLTDSKWQTASEQRGRIGDHTTEWQPSSAEEAHRASVATTTSDIDPSEEVNDQKQPRPGYTFLEDRR